MDVSANPDATDFLEEGKSRVNPERLYILWNLATQHHPNDEARIQAILAEA